MRLSPVWMIGIFVAAFSFHGHAQNASAPTSPAREAQMSQANGMPPRSSPADYASQAHAGTVTIAAEFAGHSIPRPEDPLSTEDYVVVETAFFAAPGQHIALSTGDFSLRINGKKTPLPSQAFEYVAATVKDPEWVPPDQPKEKASKTGLSTGGQSDNGPPPPVHVPIELRRAMAQYIEKSSLPQGDRALPVAGLVFFEYRGKTKNIHSLELIYSGAAGKTTLALQP